MKRNKKKFKDVVENVQPSDNSKNTSTNKVTKEKLLNKNNIKNK